MTNHKLQLPAAKAPRLLVVGEVVLDRYLWGTVERISPEAPIPVLHLKRCEERLGNAAFVAASIRALGGDARLLSVIGSDADGNALCTIAARLGLACDSLLRETDRPTIVKERLLGAAQSADRGIQQMLRVDREDPRPLSEETEAKLLARFHEEVRTADGLLVCDIDKGLLTGRVLREIIRAARSEDKPVIIDPRRADDFSIYRGASALTPNRFETQHATGLSLATAPNWPAAAKKLIDDLDLEASLVTLDRDGVFIAERDGTAVHIETTPREVYDVTGAGDVVLAVFGFCWSSGLSATDSAAVANVAASLEVARQGATVISRDELAIALRSDHHGSSHKILSLQELRNQVDSHRNDGTRVCFVDASFDSLQAQHVRLLEFARAQGDLLIAGLHCDFGAPQINRVGQEPSTSEQARILAALEAVDYVVTFDGPDAGAVVHTIKPDVFVVARENQCAGATATRQFVSSYGGRIVTTSFTSIVATAATNENNHSNGNAPVGDRLRAEHREI